MSANMKPSGTEWIGVIPAEWDVLPIRAGFNIVQGSTPDTDNSDYWDGDIPWITPADMPNEGVISSGAKRITEKGYLSCSTTMVPIGSVIISTRAPIGKVNKVVQNAVCTNQGCKALVPTRFESGYSFYCALAGKSEFVLRGRGTTFKELAAYDMGKVMFPLPAHTEQKAISDFLDDKTKDYDVATVLLEQQIETLEAYKRSLIQEAVTKGLDPDVPMKSSGVDWIGDIPVSWDCKRLKYVADFGSGTTPDANNLHYYDGAIPWIQSGDLYKVETIKETAKTVTERALWECTALQVYKRPFVVVAMYGASVGNTSLSVIDACMNQACCYIKPVGSVRYFFYTIRCAQSDLISKAQGGTQPNISQVVLKNEVVPLPPLREQEDIADYLDKKCAAIDKTLDLKREQLETLRRQRQSLIYEYVTGKRRVS